MKISKGGFIGILIASAVAFYAVMQFVVLGMGSKVAMAGVSTLLFIVLTGIIIFFDRGRIRQPAKAIADLLDRYVKGDFLAEITEDIDIPELQIISERIDALQQTLKQWLYNTLRAEVMLKEYATKLQGNAETSMGSMGIISNHIEDILEGSKVVATGSSENAAISEELLGSNTEISDYSGNFKRMTEESITTIKMIRK